jgi:hypothetical protein
MIGVLRMVDFLDGIAGAGRSTLAVGSAVAVRRAGTGNVGLAAAGAGVAGAIEALADVVFEIVHVSLLERGWLMYGTHIGSQGWAGA